MTERVLVERHRLDQHEYPAANANVELAHRMLRQARIDEHCANGHLNVDDSTRLIADRRHRSLEDVENADRLRAAQRERDVARQNPRADPLADRGCNARNVELAAVECERRKQPPGIMGGVAAARRGECDIAGVHLLDPASGEYNRPLLTPGVSLVPGYGRMSGR